MVPSFGQEGYHMYSSLASLFSRTELLHETSPLVIRYTKLNFCKGGSFSENRMGVAMYKDLRINTIMGSLSMEIYIELRY